MVELLRIAYVDDDRVFRETMSAVFERLVDSVEVFAKPQEVIDRFISEDRPDVLFTDGHMPEMSGLQLARAIRDEHPATTIVLVSAGISGIDLDSPRVLERCGIDLFIPKREFEAGAALETVKRLRAQQAPQTPT